MAIELQSVLGEVALKSEISPGSASRPTKERAATFKVSLLDFVADAVERKKILAGTSTADHTAIINAAIAATAPLKAHIYVEGTYNVSDMITGLAQGQSMSGRSFYLDGFRVSTSFNPNATCVLNLNHYVGIENIRIQYVDPFTYKYSDEDSGIANRITRSLTRSEIGTLVNGVADDRFREVPAINNPYTHTEMNCIMIQNANYGIRAVGNAGGAVWWNLKIGAFKIGVQADGLKHFLKGGAWDFWPYGVSDSTSSHWYYDGTTIGADLGDVESLAISDILCFGANVKIRQPRPGETGSHFGYIGSLSLDGNSSRLIMESGRVQIGLLYSTKDAGQAGYPGSGRSTNCYKSIVQSGGQLQIGMIDHQVNGVDEDIGVSGGYLEITGGRHIQVSGGNRSVFVTGGYAKLGFRQEANSIPVPRSIEFMAATAAGVLDAGGVTFAPMRDGESGNAVVFANDLKGSVVPRITGGWGVALTSTFQNIQCGPTDASKFGWTPSFNVTSPNGFVPIYQTRLGGLWFTERGIEFHCEVKVDCNNIGAASGKVWIGGLPALSGEFDGKAFFLGEWGGIAMDSPYRELVACYDASVNGITLAEVGTTNPGVSPLPQRLQATNFLSNNVATIKVSGFISKR